MVNEFAGQDYVCDSGSFIPTGPDYTNLAPDQYSCNVVGAVAGQPNVSGSDYIRLAYGYLPSHKVSHRNDRNRVKANSNQY